MNTIVKAPDPSTKSTTDPNQKKKNDGYDQQVHSQPIVNEQEQDVIANAEPDPEPPVDNPSTDKSQKEFEEENLPVADDEAKREAGLNP